MDQSVRYTLAPNIVFQPTADEGVLLNLTTEQYFGLNNMSRAIVDVLKEGADIGTLIDQLLQDYDVERSVLATDVNALIEELLAHQLLVAAE